MLKELKDKVKEANAAFKEVFSEKRMDELRLKHQQEYALDKSKKKVEPKFEEDE